MTAAGMFAVFRMFVLGVLQMVEHANGNIRRLRKDSHIANFSWHLPPTSLSSWARFLAKS
jgi:hypothetical protein